MNSQVPEVVSHHPDGTTSVNRGLLRQIGSGSLTNFDEVSVAIKMLRTVQDEFERFGTNGTQAFTNDDSREALLALQACCKRLGFVNFVWPFRDFSSFRSWWVSEGARGSWQARRDLLEGVFGEIAVALDHRFLEIQERQLVRPLNPEELATWPEIRREMNELRRHVASATSTADLRNIGNDCVSILERLSEFIYFHEIHGLPDTDEPAVSKTKIRLTSLIEHEYLSESKSELKRVVSAVIDLAQAIKHTPDPSGIETLVLAETLVFLIAALDRILSQGSLSI